MTSELCLRSAGLQDAEQLVELINAAYRGASSKLGWTSEADFLDGGRTDSREIMQLLTETNSLLLICGDDRKLLGSIHAHYRENQAEMGMFAVSPLHQGRGIGKRLLEFAESTARQTWEVRQFVMQVIPQRAELIAFYERRGYRRTGVYSPFPVNPHLWTPKAPDLRLELLEKLL
ncbi:MAG: GNAT family N-acetyltransferase [Methylomonas sp.]|jgi:ribosomal protein S18 acetylase RimI-like enzyme